MAGEVATTNVGGVGKWRDAYSLYLVGAQKVVLWPDWDEKGRHHMEQVYKSIKSASPKTKIEIVRSADDLKDAGDHFRAGHSLGDVVAVELPELAPHEAFIDELNEKYAVAGVGSNTVILHEYWDPGLKRPMVEFMSPSAFHLRYRNRQIGNWSIASLWLRHPHRRTYDRVVFYPGETDERYYNLWRGFSVEPCAGKCSRFLSHIKENICGGDDERYRWLMSWMAQAVQEPANRPGTAVVLRGAQGVGKGVFCQGFGSLLGTHFLQVTHSRHLIGHFNAHLKDCLILWGDEAFWARDKANEGVLRALVTEPEIVIELKGRDAARFPNLIRLIMSSNNDWVVPAALDERRFAVFDVSDRRKQDRRYFARIQEELDNGGREALLHHLMHYDYSGVDVGRIPSSAALGEQKIFSMHPVDQWWLQRLEEGGDDSSGDDWLNHVTSNDLYTECVEFLKSAGRSWRVTETEFGIRLKTLIPGLRKLRRSLRGRRAYFYGIPSLDECRKAFEARLGTEYEWPEDDADSKGSHSGRAPAKRRKRKVNTRKKIKRKAG